jgi:transcriptional regulator with XRE-family HTH domain
MPKRIALRQPSDWALGVRSRIEERMRAQGLSQRELGGLVGVSGAAVAAWVEGADFKNWWTCRALAAALGVTVDWLLDAGEEGTPGVSPDIIERAARELDRQASEAEKVVERAKAAAARLRDAAPRKR